MQLRAKNTRKKLLFLSTIFPLFTTNAWNQQEPHYLCMCVKKAIVRFFMKFTKPLENAEENATKLTTSQAENLSFAIYSRCKGVYFDTCVSCKNIKPKNTFSLRERSRTNLLCLSKNFSQNILR